MKSKKALQLKRNKRC